MSGIACQAIAYLVGLFLILRVHAPEAGIRDFLGVRPTHWLFYPLAVALGPRAGAPRQRPLRRHRAPLAGHPDKDSISSSSRPPRRPSGRSSRWWSSSSGPMLEEVLFRGALFRPMLKVAPCADGDRGDGDALRHRAPLGPDVPAHRLRRAGAGRGALGERLAGALDAAPRHLQRRAVLHHGRAAPGGLQRTRGARRRAGSSPRAASRWCSCSAAVRLLGRRSRDAALAREFDLR